MSAHLPSYCFQTVTERNRLNWSLWQLVPDRYQFESVTNCNQLDRGILMGMGLIACMLISACHEPAPAKQAPPKEIHTADYDLLIPTEQKALLILFPCFPCDATDTRTESHIVDTCAAHDIAVLMMNFNWHMVMTDAEREAVIGTIEEAVKANALDAQNTFIGGFSTGGNVSLSIAKSLVARESPVHLKGVFAVDSPLDLVHLYECAQRDLQKTSFPEYKDEARMVIAMLDSALGSPTDSFANYERFAPLLNTTTSVAPLKDLPIRFYTEPDTAWWRANRDDAYEELNAFALKRIYDTLQAVGNTRAEYITTEGRGVQHGNRHPHAWSIVDEKELVKWIQSLSH